MGLSNGVTDADRHLYILLYFTISVATEEKKINVTDQKLRVASLRVEGNLVTYKSFTWAIFR